MCSFVNQEIMYCVTENILCFTPEGPKSYKNLKPEDSVYSLNLKTGKIEEDKILKLGFYKYKGKLYNFNSCILNFQITPDHKTVFLIPSRANKNRYFLATAENVFRLRKTSKEKFIIPLTGEIEKEEPVISEEEIRLFAWILASEPRYLTENSISICFCDESSFARVFYLADKAGIYALKSQTTPVQTCPVHSTAKYILILTGELLAKQHEYIISKKIPEKIIKYGNKYTFKTFIKEYLLALSCLYGFNERKILEKNEKFIDHFQLLCTLSGIATRKIQRDGFYSLEFYEKPFATISNVKEIEYQGIVWCPETINKTFIAYKDGTPFIIGTKQIKR